MAVQFTSCPACGAVGEIGSACQFCGTTIVQKEGVIATNSRIVNVRTVSPQEYANKVAIYHQIESSGNIAIVRIGDQKGVINLNGDLIWPLGGYDIYIKSDFVISVHLNYKSTEIDKYRFINLETLEESAFCYFVRDPNNPQHLHRLIDGEKWRIENSYKNIKGEIQEYEYAEKIGIVDTCFPNRGIYLLHKKNGCALWIVGDRPNCILENVKSVQEPVWQGNKEILPIELVDGRKVNITLRTSTNINGKECYKRTETEDIYKEWGQKTGFDLPLNTENPSPEDPSPEDQEKESSFSCIFQVLIMLIILLGIAWWKGWI